MKIINQNLIQKLISEINPHINQLADPAQSNLFDHGILDSYYMIELVSNLENKVGITFDYLDFQFRHFKTVSSIVDLLLKKYDCHLDNH